MATKSTAKDKVVLYEQLKDTFDDLHVGVFTVDSKRRLTSFNRTAELLTGYAEREVLGKYCYQIFDNKLCYGDCKFREAVEADQKSLRFNLEFTDRQNKKQLITKIVTPLYDADRKLKGCMEVFQSHSTFEELVSRIRYEDRRLKIILDNLDIGVFTTTRGGHVTFFNRFAETISGRKREDVLGRPCTNFLGGERGSDAVLLQQCIGDGKPRSNNQGVIIAKDKRAVPTRANYMALRNEQGYIVGGLATIQDLSVIHQLNRAIKDRYTLADMIGKAPSMQKIFEILPVVATSEATILIEGSTGTGKDLLAKVIHNISNRAKKPFVKVNCAALPDNLLESEMFGYVKGAFTGAERDKPGRFQEAHKGTIFLDEIGDLPLSLQGKLLRVLEDKEFYSLGSRKTTKVDVRIIAATNQGLERQVEMKKFRKDLFYRINVIRFELPPLVERRGDIPLLIYHILKQLSTLKSAKADRISENAMEILLNYDYPGNVRELENILEHVLIICQGKIAERKHLPLFLQKGISPTISPVAPDKENGPDIGHHEKRLIFEALSKNDWHRGRTASELHMDRSTLWRKMKRYGISR